MKRLLSPWSATDPTGVRMLKTARDVAGAGAVGWIVGMAAAALVLLILGTLSGCGPRGSTSGVGPIILVTPLPSTLTKYTPAVYDEFGMPIRSADDSTAGPVLWLWPTGRVDVPALEFHGYYPARPAFPISARGGYEMRLNASGHVTEGIAAGWSTTLTDFAVNDSSRVVFPGFTLADIPNAVLTGIRVDVVATSDSVLEVTARVFYTAGSEQDTAGTFVRLVHERFGR